MKNYKLKSACWITWEKQTRNKSMSTALSIPLFELISDKKRAIRYLVLSFKTLKILLKKEFKIIFCQNPSIVLSFLCVLSSFVTNKKIIIDAHNSGIYPLDGNSKVLNFITKFIFKHSYMVIVTNENLSHAAKEMGGHPFVMPDPIPAIPNLELDQQKANYLLFICTWASDEPVREVFSAAEKNKINIVVTGNFKRILSDKEVKALPGNIFLSGFLSEDDYFKYLNSSSATIDLTTRDDCLVCGAYESIAAGKPGIISDSESSRKTFPTGFIFTKNTADDISEAMIKIMEENLRYQEEIISCKEHRRKETENQVIAIKKIVNMEAIHD